MGWNNKSNTVTESRLFVIRKVDVNDKMKTELRVVSWNYKQPQLENRSYFMKNGTWICGKNLGLRKPELIALAEVSEKIVPLLELTDQDDIRQVEAARNARVAKATA